MQDQITTAFENRIPDGGRVLWIGAHPDDELFAAPLLGAMRELRRVRVDFVVATRGERGPCHLPGGCGPDLASFRDAEMRAAAALFGGAVTLLGCRDGSAPQPDQVLYHWGNDVGSAGMLRDRLWEAVDAAEPDVILTLDPDHGSTHHADHCAIGELVVSTLDRSRVWLAETRVHWGPEVHISAHRDDGIRFDVRDWWEYLRRDIRCHRSQFKPELIDAFDRVPKEERSLWFVKA